MIIVNATSAYSPEAISRLHTITARARDSLSRTSLADSRISATGLAAGFRDLHNMIMSDLVLIAACALVFIFLILVGLLRSLLAPLYLIATIVLSYAAALGLTVLVWQECLGIDVYWAVPRLAFVALVAVGSDYNRMLISRIRAESATGLNTGILRAFKATGGVVSTAGVIFALTMLAMLASPTHSIGQVGFTIGAGSALSSSRARAGPGVTRQQIEKRRAFRRTIKWRTGCAGRISILKRGYGWDRTRLDSLEGADNEVFGLGAHRFSLSWICGEAANLRAETEVDHRANTTISSGARTYL